ncbi:response regulator transcription factor [Cupriavidus plantarum]|uniref:DNA-binding response OmpR family regulator n=1 Tax=Cupriavidus plantarum TaxID=942865 RepID=A0A316ELZ2_9BURK|nr:response regulator transcription factor [Cupriavidus plantarum]PWK32647.1 DNA-binding response OmpR family regulator [Cupriavidus plantarum]RLK33413.1 DNA-binding response OmpR family regulator [Cupriavidus plantarum]CAG2151608.1 Transcriptional regulatory protein CpxR [Cupriavidus plantarum]SMR85129.1 DNA-binding response regulator, OmpR family, contains REC and winged-helix (wHTH) domain [Cupriavidus plantarum]
MKVATTSVEILLIDDDADLCEMLGEYLAGEGFAVTACANGEAAADMAASGRYAAVLLDIMLPRVSGIDVLRQIRARCGVPVIMLTAKGSDIDRVIGLELGADDYVPKPCYPRELVARLRAVLRRTQGGAVAERGDELAAGPVSIVPSQRTARVGAQAVDLTVTEFNLLEYLLRNADRAVSKDDLSLQVLGRPRMPYDRSLDVHVGNLRQKLSAAGAPESMIATVWGFGYRLDAQQAE